jgi:hypothetical protein
MNKETVFNNSLRRGLSVSMSEKLKGLREKQAKLMSKLDSGFDYEAFKELNIVNQHIDVAEERKAGKWLSGGNNEYPELATKAINLN